MKPYYCAKSQHFLVISTESGNAIFAVAEKSPGRVESINPYYRKQLLSLILYNVHNFVIVVILRINFLKLAVKIAGKML